MTVLPRPPVLHPLHPRVPLLPERGAALGQVPVRQRRGALGLQAELQAGLPLGRMETEMCAQELTTSPSFRSDLCLHRYI